MLAVGSFLFLRLSSLNTDFCHTEICHTKKNGVESAKKFICAIKYSLSTLYDTCYGYHSPLTQDIIT